MAEPPKLTKESSPPDEARAPRPAVGERRRAWAAIRWRMHRALRRLVGVLRRLVRVPRRLVRVLRRAYGKTKKRLTKVRRRVKRWLKYRRKVQPVWLVVLAHMTRADTARSRLLRSRFSNDLEQLGRRLPYRLLLPRVDSSSATPDEADRPARSRSGD